MSLPQWVRSIDIVLRWERIKFSSPTWEPPFTGRVAACVGGNGLYLHILPQRLALPPQSGSSLPQTIPLTWKVHGSGTPDGFFRARIPAAGASPLAWLLWSLMPHIEIQQWDPSWWFH